MSETNVTSPAKEGPALADSVVEVQGWFPNDETMQAAMGQLGLAGYDRSDFSLPEEQPEAATPTEGADNPTDAIDKRQLRTMGASMAGYIGGAAAAGAVIATGGAAAVAAAGAAAVAAGATLASDAAGVATERATVEERNRRGAAGTLVLAVRTRTQDQVGQVTEVLRAAGATRTEAVTRKDEALTTGVSAASWTG